MVDQEPEEPTPPAADRDRATGPQPEDTYPLPRPGPTGSAPSGGTTRADDATQILPRPRSGYGARSDFDRDAGDDLADFAPIPGRLGRRTRLGLVIGAVAAVVVIGLGIGYAVLHLGSATSPGRVPTPAAASGSATPPASASPRPADLLGDATMLSARQATAIDPTRTWKVAQTQPEAGQDSAQPACLAARAAQGQPAPAQTVLRLLSASGKNPPAVLHRADAYATPADAAQAFSLASRSLGSCPMTGAYLSAGGAVSGLGDQAVAAVVSVSGGQYRSVVLNRTGRVVNVVDAARPSTPIPLAAVATGLAGVTDTECRAAAGRCAAGTTVQPGPPPVGVDGPGFLTTGDLPPVGRPAATWAATVPSTPDPDFTGSGCETVGWAKEAAQRRGARTFLLQDQSLTFGLDDIVLTEPTPAAASALVARVKKDLDTCAARRLTASVSKPGKVRGTGAAGEAVAGWTTVVDQQTTEGTARYRVGIVSVGTRAVYTFLNPQKSLDLTDAQWDLVAARAGERATQLR